MKTKTLFLRLALIAAVWALAIPKAFGYSTYYQYNVHVATNPTGVAKVYVKQSSEADEKYQLNTSGLMSIGGSTTTWNFKCDEDEDEASPGYFFVGWSLDQPATEESDIVDTSNPSGAIAIQSTKFLYGAEEATPNPIPWDENYKQLVFANFTRLQVESEDDTRGTAAILGSPLVVKDGDQVRIKATAATGYKFAGWKFNDGTEYASIQNPYPITIGDETAGTYTACFDVSTEVVEHNIIIEETANGTVKAIPTSAQADVIPTLIVTPDPGYETVSVKYNEIDATKMAPPKEYSFTMPNDDVYVIVKFGLIKPKGLTVDAIKAKATISWEENDQTSWKLQYGTDSSFKEGTYTEKDVNTTPSITLTGLDEDQGYYVRVKAYNGTDESEWSDAVSFYPTDIPVIGDYTSIDTDLPTYTRTMYSLTQQIYTAAELGEAGLIESIGFYNTSSATTRNLDIYMVSTDKTQFAGSSDGIPVTDDDLVFSGEVTFAENKWTTITLTQPFIYDGTNNVAIIVDDNTGSVQIPSTVFRVYPTATSQAIYISDYISFVIGGTPFNYDPKSIEGVSFTTTTSKNQIRILKSKLEAYAVLTDNEDGEGKTLTFYFDGNKPTGDNVYDLPWTTDSFAPWASNSEITTVEFNESFAEYNGLTNLYGMFANLTKLTAITGLDYLNTKNVTNMGYMFYACTSLETLDVSNFNTEKVENMRNMFYNCNKLETLDVNSFDTENVKNMTSMFAGCKFTTLYCNKNWAKEGLVSDRMFYQCTKLVGGSSTVYDADHIDAAYAHPDGGKDDPGYFTAREAYAILDGTTLKFYYDENKPTGDNVYDIPWTGTYPGWTSSDGNTTITTVEFDVSFGNYYGLTSTKNMFYNCEALETLDLSNFNTGNVTNMSWMFYNCYALETLELGDNFDTSNVKDMSCMFDGCKALETLDVSKFNTENVTAMSFMFAYCYAFETLDLSNFDTSNVTNMSFMFYECTSLETLDVSNFNTSNVTDMSYMFRDCKALTSLDLSNFNTSNVTDMSQMFAFCEALTSLDVSNFNTSNVEDMKSMFYGCKAFTSLDLSNFNTSNVEDMSYMFYNCYALETIYCAKDADWSGVEDRNYTSMFSGCTKLSGKYSSKKFPWDGTINGTYAKMYNGTDGGYFTYKGNEDYILTVTEAGMATLYLEYNAVIPNGVEVYYCTGLDDNEAVPTTHAQQISSSYLIPAKTGVFVKAPQGEYKFEHPKSNELYIIPTIKDNILEGTLEDMTVDSHSVLTLGKGNKTGEYGFWWYTGTTIPANRAYIPGIALEADVKGITIVFDDETRIEEIVNGKSSNGKSDEWYDLSGRKLEGKPTQKGIYINNGRKTLIK